jgi:hypothetical protein
MVGLAFEPDSRAVVGDYALECHAAEQGGSSGRPGLWPGQRSVECGASGREKAAGVIGQGVLPTP